MRPYYFVNSILGMERYEQRNSLAQMPNRLQLFTFAINRRWAIY